MTSEVDGVPSSEVYDDDVRRTRAVEYAASRGISPESVELFGLYYDRSKRGIAIPYYSAIGKHVATRHRQIDGGAKYLGEAGSNLHLFNVVDAYESPVYLTEGEFDCIVLKQLGLHAVGVPGIQGFKEEWKWLFQSARVLIAFDGDDAGRTGARKVARVLGTVTSDVSIIDMPEGMDITDLHLQGRLKEVLGLDVLA